MSTRAFVRRWHTTPTRFTPSGFALTLVAASLAGVSSARAQSPVPPAAPATVSQPQLALYRAPLLALVQPTAGGTVPRDKPIAVFRFVQGESDDPLNLGSFRVAVDGHDVSAGFQVAAVQAWGALGDVTLASGEHVVSARLCSARGACTAVSATVSVVGAAALPDAARAPSERGRVLDFLIRTTRKLLAP